MVSYAVWPACMNEAECCHIQSAIFGPPRPRPFQRQLVPILLPQQGPETCFLLQAGTLMAASTRFNAMVRGRGGHAGEPHLARDPVIAAAAIVQVMFCFWCNLRATILQCSAT